MNQPSAESSSNDLISDPIAVVAEEFVASLRAGERPSIRTYCERHPELADRIRALFPTIAAMEGLGQGVDASATVCELPIRTAAGDCLNDYRLLFEIGRGGMGIVYEAEQQSLGRRVALKVLPPQAVLDPRRVQRFRREAQAAARLHHTNIVPVFGVGEEHGVHYYVMQLIAGPSLDQVLGVLRDARTDSRETVAGLAGSSAMPRDPRRLPNRPVANHALARHLARLLCQHELHHIDRRLRSEGERDASVEPPTFPAATEATKQVVPIAPRLTGEQTGQRDGDAAGDAAGARAQLSAGQSYWRNVARIGIDVAESLGYAFGHGVLHRDIKPSNLLLDAEGAVWVTDFGLAKSLDSADVTQTNDVVGTLRYLAPERLRGECDLRSDLYSLGMTLYEMLTLRPAFCDTDQSRMMRQIMDVAPPQPRTLDAAIPRDLETIVLKAIAKDPRDRYDSAEALADDLRNFLQDRPIAARRFSPRERLWRWSRRNPLVASLTGVVFSLLAALVVLAGIDNARLSRALNAERKNLSRAETAERETRLREADALVGESRGQRLVSQDGRRFTALATLAKAAAIGRELDQPPAWFARLRNEAIAALAHPDFFVSRRWPRWADRLARASFSPDGRFYAEADATGAIAVFRMADRSLIAKIEGDGEERKVQLSADGGELVRCNFRDLPPRSVCDLFHLREGRAIHVATMTDATFVRFVERPHGRKLYCLYTDGSFAVYDVATGAREHRVGPISTPMRSRFVVHPTASVVAIHGYQKNDVTVRNVETGEILAVATPGWEGGCRAAWHPSGRYLLVMNTDGPETRVYDVDPSAGALRYSRSIRMGGADGYIQFNASGDRLIGNNWGQQVRVVDFWTGRELAFTRSSSVAEGWPSELSVIDGGDQLGPAAIEEDHRTLGLWSMADGREFRRLIATDEKPSSHSFAIHPSGQFVVQQSAAGFCFFDLPTGAHVATLPIPALDDDSRRHSAWFDASGNLYTNSMSGAFRWPVQADVPRRGHWTIGPPVRLPFHPGSQWISTSHDGAVIVQTMWLGYGMDKHAGGWLLHPSSPFPRWCDRGASLGVAAVSPDGRWVAIRDHVADSATGAIEPRSKGLAQWRKFSGDGRLVLGNHGNRGLAIATETWEQVSDLGSGAVTDCSSDPSPLAVLCLNNGVVRLVEVRSGREIVRLEDPEQQAREAVFTSDNTQLVAQTLDGLCVWNLRRIREELSKIGLDWDLPPYPPAPPAPRIPLPIVVNFVGLELLDKRTLGARTPLVNLALDYAWLQAKTDTERQAITVVRTQLPLVRSKDDLLQAIDRQQGLSPLVRVRARLIIEQIEPRELDEYLRSHRALGEEGSRSAP